jgi:mRNA interferase RelE/StbE
MYRITITSRGEKDLRKIERQSKNKIVEAILKLKEDPRPQGCRKVLSEAGIWRIRVGDWRIGYAINDDANEITVIRVAHRREFYA